MSDFTIDSPEFKALVSEVREKCHSVPPNVWSGGCRIVFETPLPRGAMLSAEMVEQIKEATGFFVLEISNDSARARWDAMEAE